MKRRTWGLALILALLVPSAAAAEPITAIITAINAFAATSALAGFAVRLGVSLALSALSAALSKRDTPRAPGIKTEATTTGGTVPQSLILGRYATGGHMDAPPYSGPNSGAVPNEFLTYVVDVSDMPGCSLSRLIVAGEYVTDLQASAGDHDLEGLFVEGTPHLFVTFYDGTQGAADPYLLAEYGAHPDRPWSADMVLTGTCYAVLTFRYNREVFNQMPGVRLEVDGVPLYDPRLDSTGSGSGAHRWNDPTTWGQTNNPVVMIYNILRGFTLPDGRRWGGDVAAADLPLDVWFAAMNECDAATALEGGGTEPQYRAGLEVSLGDDEPAAVIDQLLNACSGEIVEMGGVYKVRVGPPALPVYFFSDADVVVDQPESMIPHPGLEGVHNAIHATYPDPVALWEARDAPPRYNATWEAQDAGRQLVAEVALDAVPYQFQVQRLMKAWIEDERRLVRHNLALPPDAAILEPLDTCAWTSARRGYTTKVFEVGEVSDDPLTVIQSLSIREREAGDYSWTPATDQIDIFHGSTAVTTPAPRAVANFAAAPAEVRDGADAARRPALSLTWTGAGISDATGMAYQVRVKGRADLASQGATADPTEGEVLVSDGIVGGQTYEARLRLVSRFASVWTSWVEVVAPDVRLAAGDLDDDLQASLFITDIQSDDFATGATGWRIAKSGAAEFNSLIVRNSLVDGAVSDGGSGTAYPAPVAAAANATAIYLELGPWVLDASWSIAVQVSYRHRQTYTQETGGGKAGTIFEARENRTRPNLFFRTKSTVGGAWGAYELVHSFEWSDSATVWLEDFHLVNQIGVYADVGFSLVLQNDTALVSNGGVYSSVSDIANVSNFALVARAVRR